MPLFFFLTFLIPLFSKRGGGRRSLTTGYLNFIGKYFSCLCRDNAALRQTRERIKKCSFQRCCCLSPWDNRPCCRLTIFFHTFVVQCSLHGYWLINCFLVELWTNI
jgi:hypothetical protein